MTTLEKVQASLDKQLQKLASLGYPDAEMTPQIRSVLAHVSMAKKRLDAFKDTSKDWHAPNRREGRNKTWCGPYALATVLGTTYEEADEMVKKLRGITRSTIGMYNHEMDSIIGGLVKKDYNRMADLGYTIGQQPPTLAKFVRQHPKGLFVVNVTGHYVVIRDGYIIDNQLPEWKPMGKRHNRRRVRRAWELN